MRAGELRRAGVAVLCASAVLGAPLVGGPPAHAATASAAPPSLSVRAAILIDEDTGNELYGVAPNHTLAIASTTKLMTALITLEHARLSRVFTEPNFYFPPIDSQLGLTPGERMSVHDLLIALLLPSADDAAEDLAYNVGGRSVARFVGMMNARARQLGLRHTHYSTPTGLSSSDRSSAGDLVKLAAYVLRTQPFFARVVALPHAVLSTGNHRRLVTNRNDLVGRYSWVRGVKTGHTSLAGYVLVGLGERHNMRLLSAVMGTASEISRDDNTLALLDYGFSHFRRFMPITRNEVIARPTVKDSPGKHAVVVAARAFEQVLPRDARVRVVVKVPSQLAGPLAWHAVVGSATVIASGRTLARIPLLLAHRLPAVSPLTVAARFMTRTSTLLMLAFVCILAISVIARRRLRMRHAGQEGAEPA